MGVHLFQPYDTECDAVRHQMRCCAMLCDTNSAHTSHWLQQLRSTHTKCQHTEAILKLAARMQTEAENTSQTKAAVRMTGAHFQRVQCFWKQSCGADTCSSCQQSCNTCSSALHDVTRLTHNLRHKAAQHPTSTPRNNTTTLADKQTAAPTSMQRRKKLQCCKQAML